MNFIDKVHSHVAHLYKNGQHVPQDDKLAMDWYKKAASNGNSCAQNNIGFMYQKGLGVPQDYKVAMESYQKAASDRVNAAQYIIREMYENGHGVTKNVDIAADNGFGRAKKSLKRLNKIRNATVTVSVTVRMS